MQNLGRTIERGFDEIGGPTQINVGDVSFQNSFVVSSRR